MMLAIILHPKPYYHKHAPTTLCCLYIALILVFPPLVNARYHEENDGDLRTSSDLLVIGFVLVIAVVFLAVVYVVVNLWCKSQVGFQMGARDSQDYSTTPGLDPSIVERLPVFKYSEVEAYRAHSSPLECAVCLSPYEPDEKLRLLPKCNHAFHVECLNPWLKGHSTCPLCRIDLVPETGESSQVESGEVNGAGGEVNEVGNDDNNVLELRVDIDEEGHIRKFRRCKSTGHVAEAQRGEGECWMRFTLMLPEMERNKFGEVMNKFKRTRSSK